MQSKEKVSLFSSIKMKINILVFGAITMVALVILLTIVPLIKENMSSTTQSYMKDITVVAGANIDKELEILGIEAALTPEELGSIVGDITIKEMSSSYAYVVSKDGTMLYHPTPDKIGAPVENEAVTGLVAEIAKGNIPEPDVIEYLYKGVMKYASYYIGADAAFILVITADEDEVFADMNAIVSRSMFSTIVTAIVCLIVALIIATLIIKPLEQTISIIRKIADLDFRKDEIHTRVIKRKDESGLMARAVEHLREELVTVISKITGQSKDLYVTAGSLNSSAYETSESVEQVEKAISEIAEGATSQAAETQTATENIIVMGNMIEETNDEVEKLRENARAMRSAGDVAMNILKDLSAVNQKTKDAMQVIYAQTNVTNDSALKIKEAVNIITDIAEETNLLSLNASIEAARAGEQGRGFAVVAAQIQKLAEQSNESAKQIEQIINVLINESQKSVETMEEVKVVIDKQDENVQHTGDAFQNVKDGISSSIDVIRIIAAKTKQLDEARVRVVDVVQNLTAIAEENAASTEETSASAAEVSAIMGTIAENTGHLNGIAHELEESVKQFVTE
ncbi:MAG: methyl-accepting chemotaxis protein [Lachnospiraceae bacterium]|nr:methyl-accepting chemotaxis protein [Lachnospiraceae bacterium]